MTPRRTGRIVFWVIFAAAVASFVAAFLWGKQTVASFSVPTTTMEPTVQPGDVALVSLGSAVRRGDIVIVRLPPGFPARGQPDFPASLRTGSFIRRVIGLPGDRVACCDSRGRVTVNGKPLNETYLYPGDPPSETPFSVTLGSGKLWVLADARSISIDSRAWGPIPESDVTGRVEVIVRGRSLRQVRTPQTFVAEGLAPPDGRTPTVEEPLALAFVAVLTLLALTVFGIIRTVIRRRRGRRIRRADPNALVTG
jgi:signal peptidase I